MTRLRQTLLAAGGGVVLAVMFGGALVAWNAHGAATSEGKSAEKTATSDQAATGRPVVAVVTTPARQMLFEERLSIAGTVLAKRFALVSARVPGTLDQVFVDAGDVVEAGTTKLFQTDSLKLEQAAAIAHQQLTVSECAVREKQALLEKTQVALEQAMADLTRYRHLREQNAIAQQVVEHQAAQCRQLESDVRHTQSLIELAQAQLEQARLNYRIAQKDLSDSLVTAPISGRVSIRLKEPGEMAGAGTPVLRIDDGSLVELSVFVPAEYYDRVQPGATKLRARIGSAALTDLPVTFKSPTVESKLRTFQVKALVDSPPAEVVPGALAQVELILTARQGIGVPASAVLQRDGQAVVFTVRPDATARRAAVEPGLENDGWREIRRGISAGEAVISMGQTMVDDGTAVRVVEEGGR